MTKDSAPKKGTEESVHSDPSESESIENSSYISHRSKKIKKDPSASYFARLSAKYQRKYDRLQLLREKVKAHEIILMSAKLELHDELVKVGPLVDP